MSVIWGLDLGGTKIEGVVMDYHAGQAPGILSRRRVPTESQHGYQHIIHQIQTLIGQLSQDTGVKPQSIGMGTPGTTEPSTGLLKNSNTICLNGMPFREDLQKALGIPVRLANDANCFAVAEALLGAVPQAVPEARVVFGIIMGTGVGGGLVIDGKVWNGRHGIGGEWGHNFLDESGGRCYCGKIGCVETLLSGPALERYYTSLSHQKLPMHEIIRRAEEGSDPHAIETRKRMLHFFGIATTYLINILDPDAIVIGGGVGNCDALYTEGVQEVAKHIFNPRIETAFLKPALGDSAGVFGAALL